MLGNTIVISSQPMGKFVEGFIKTAEKPGTIVMQDLSVPMRQGAAQWVVYDRTASGDRPAGPLIVLREDNLQGKTTSDAYIAGARAFGYIPLPGDELNVLLKDIAGTADDHPAGQLLEVDDATGKLIAATGTPQQSAFQMMETINDPVADQLAWVVYGL